MRGKNNHSVLSAEDKKKYWHYKMRCRHCERIEFYLVDKKMPYENFLRERSRTEALVKIQYCEGCKYQGVFDLVAICSEDAKDNKDA